MRFLGAHWKKYLQRKISIVSIVAVLALAAVLPAGTAESPGDPKRAAFDVVERNAEEIATVGDVLYYYAEPGMQEYESAKFVKETLEQRGVQSGARRRRHADQCLGKVGFG